MILERIEVTNFLSHGHSVVDFTGAPLWLVAGDNGSGKSALFDAVEYALYGQHRGRQHNAELLVKQGTRSAQITIVFQLQGERLCVVHQIDAVRGNLGGRLAVWDDTIPDWKPRNVGAGVRAVWDWLRDRLPQHEHFRSAIFLRQNETAYFLRGNTSDRSKRFAALVDLTRYTRLSQRARTHAQQASDERHRVEGMRSILGDLSDGRLEVLRQDAVRLEQDMVAAREAARLARDRRAVAEQWAELQTRRQRLEQTLAGVDALLREEPTIQDALARVSTWEDMAEALRQYWSQRDTASGKRSEAACKRKDAKATNEQQRAATDELASIRARLQQIVEQDRPQAERAAAEAVEHHRRLEHELGVSTARLTFDRARETTERLAGADITLQHWQARQSALPRMAAVASAHADVATLRYALPELEEASKRDEHNLEQARADLKAAEEELQQHREHHRACADRVGVIQTAIARLEAQVSGHATLTGGEAACPVCAQELDQQAHAQIQSILATEHAELVAKQAEVREQAQPDLEQAQRDVEDAERIVKRRRRELEVATSAAGQAARAFELAQTRLDGAQATLQRAVDQLLAEDPHPPIAPDSIDRAAVNAERTEIAAMIGPTGENAKELARAREHALRTEQTLRLLRDQRAAGTEPLGDTLAPDAVEARRRAQDEEATARQQQVARLTAEHAKLVGMENSKVVAVTRLTAEGDAARQRADELEQEAAAAEREADIIAAPVRVEWVALLGDRAAYEQQQATITTLRPLARRAGELAEARGRRTGIVIDLAEVTAADEKISPDQRVPVEKARDDERDAEQAAMQAETDHSVAKRVVQELLDNRRRDQALSAEIRRLNDDVAIFGELAELLKEHGAIQRQVAQQEQRRVALEANHILHLLNDPLRIRIDQARRGEDQDVTIVDISDMAGSAGTTPDGSRRYFEFLSGGEQFRIALALALALHRRLGGGEPGTVIVDEGFGALDGDRRDALALQMTDTSQGILGLGLARNLIICSHAAEVQRHFPNRWIVEKRSGTAHVRRENGASV